MKTIANTGQNLSLLGLRGMAEAYQRQLETPSLLKESFDSRLGLMIDAETTERQTRKIQRLLKSAKLRESTASLDKVEFNASRGVDRNIVMGLGECDWVRMHQNIIVTGATGTGKTWLGCAFGNQACRLGFPTLYFTASRLQEEMELAVANRSVSKMRRQMSRFMLLIIDDFGIGDQIDEHGALFLELIDQQSQKGSVIITSQFPTDKWHSFFANSTVADAVLDRILHNSHMINLTGESMRRKGKGKGKTK